MVRIIGSFGAALREATAGPEEAAGFEFCGETFTMADHLGAAPLMKFAAALENHTDLRDIRFLASMNALIRDCLESEAEYERFMEAAATHKATADDIFAVCRGVWEELSGRPTKRPSDSSDGPPPPSRNLKPKSSASGGKKSATVTKMERLPRTGS